MDSNALSFYGSKIDLLQFLASLNNFGHNTHIWDLQVFRPVVLLQPQILEIDRKLVNPRFFSVLHDRFYVFQTTLFAYNSQTFFLTTYDISKVCIIKGYLQFFVITFSQTSSYNISEDSEGGLIRIRGTIIAGPTRPFGFALKSLSV